MDIRELIDTLNNVVNKGDEVMVKVGDTFTGISHINIGSAGILVHLEDYLPGTVVKVGD